MTSPWQLMQAEHDRIWDHLNALTGAPGDRADEAKTSRRIAKDLVALASGHEAAEEMVVWPVVRERCPDGRGLVEQVLEQENEMKRAVNELAHVSAGTPDFDEVCRTIAGRTRTHISYEQNQVWPRLADALSEQEAGDLARRWETMRRTAPSKPHPHLMRVLARLRSGATG